MMIRELALLWWTWACVWDHTPSTSKLVVFSSDNPWLRAYNHLMLSVGGVPVFPGGASPERQGSGTTAVFNYNPCLEPGNQRKSMIQETSG